MNRSPLFYPLNRGMDADAGGAAELQTDVMRFMAIISMCLVAIFALVQSIPLAPQPPPPVVDKKAEPIAPVEPADDSGQAAEPEANAVSLVRPTPAAPRRTASPVPLQRPLRKPSPAVTTPSPDTAPPAPPLAEPTPERKGFTLRFESDAVLTRLVENETVGLYVLGDNEARRLQVASGRISFWTSSTPGQFHEMDPDTVPASFVTTWNRQHGPGDTNTKWGVSLPSFMSRQVSEHVSGSDGGSLIIDSSGQVRLEQ